MVLLSAVVAFGLWLYVVTVISPESEETYYNIPVILEGQSLLTERGLMVTENANPTVMLTLSGNRTDLNKLNSSNIKVVANLSSIAENGDYNLNYSISFPGEVSGSLQPVESEPAFITLKVEREIKKMVDIQVYYTGSVPEDYIADIENKVMDYTRVTITGPEPVINQIAYARVEVDLTDRTDSFSENYRFTLCNAEGEPVDVSHVETSIAEVNLTLKIQRMKEIALKLNIVEGGGATISTSKITIDPAVIKVSGSEKALENLTELVIGTVNLAEHTGTSYQTTFPVVLPNGVTNLTGVQEVSVTIQFPDLLKKTFTVTNIEALNLPMGMEMELLNKSLAVTVRGPKDLVERMTAADITVTVDLSDAKLGTTSLKAEITVAQGFEKVGAVGGPYSIYTTLREANT